MSTMTAQWSAPVTGKRGAGGRRTVRSAADVDELLAAITDFPAEAAIIYHEDRPMVQLPDVDDGDFPDHTVEVAVRDGWGYVRMCIQDDGDWWWITDGEPTSPAYVQGESEFPAGSGVPVAEVAGALKEFLRTARRPMSLRWVEDA
jgi:Immunity protein Imm1